MPDIVWAIYRIIRMIPHTINTMRNRIFISWTLSLEGINPWRSVSIISADWTIICNSISPCYNTVILAGCWPLCLCWCDWQTCHWSISCEWVGRISGTFSQIRPMNWADGISTTATWTSKIYPRAITNFPLTDAPWPYLISNFYGTMNPTRLPDASSSFWLSDFNIAPATSFYIIGNGYGTGVDKTCWITLSQTSTLWSMSGI